MLSSFRSQARAKARIAEQPLDRVGKTLPISLYEQTILSVNYRLTNTTFSDTDHGCPGAVGITDEPARSRGDNK